MPLKIYNTLTRKKEEFKPIHDGRVGIYVCGPTVYGHSHIGHAKSYVSFDVIVRYLRYLGYKVLYVQNITDVGHLTDDADQGEDKIEKQSRLDRVHPMEIAQKYTQSYFEDMDKLGVQRPNISPTATGHIIEQIDIVKTLLEKGYAYEVNGSVYFDVQKFKEYGKLSGRSIEDMVAGIRVDIHDDKRHPADFALWKKAEPGHIMQWESPWGKGYPGWHIECSAMSMKYLGVPPDSGIDIHGGGLENQFPHHECEIAQSEAATGKPFVKYWIHNNMVTVNGQKMGKSLGNVINLKDAFKTYHPLVVRFFILQSHYRSTLDFSDDALEGAAKGLEKLHNTLRNVRSELIKGVTGGLQIDIDGFKSNFLEAMDDDFNTPQAIAVLFDLSREINAILNEGKATSEDLGKVDDLFTELGGNILGIIPTTFESGAGKSIEEDLINLIIELRAEVRSQKLWPLSDKIRDGLNKIGVIIEDKKDGTSWRKIN
ncbi:MAG: cysteine--tRNA ligase [Bacteroidota bacterium]